MQPEIKFDFPLSKYWEIKEKRYCFDIEANGLLKEVSLFFCAVIENVDNGDIFYYTLDNVQEFLDELSKAAWLIGHNIIGYDMPALKKLYNWQPNPETLIYDTVIAARIYDPNFPMHPDCPKRVVNAHNTKKEQIKQRAELYAAGWEIEDIEEKVSKIKIMKSVGPHTLMNLGYHVGCHKGDFGEDEAFDQYTPEMMVYCAQDVTVNVKVFEMLEKKLKAWSRQSIQCEMHVSDYISYQMRAGWFFDIEGADRLQNSLQLIKDDIEAQVRERFKPIPVPKSLEEGEPEISHPRVKGDGKVSSVGLKAHFGADWESMFVPPNFTRKVGAIEYHDGFHTKINWKEFNLGSRPQIAERLQRLGITLTKFTAKGNPIIDDGVLNKLHEKHPEIPELLLLKRYFKVSKILSMVTGWMTAYDWDTGCIHGYVNSVGAVTNRMTHSAPNVAQTPSAKSAKIKGAFDPVDKTLVADFKDGDSAVVVILSNDCETTGYPEGTVVKLDIKRKKILSALYTHKAFVKPVPEIVAAGSSLIWGEEGAWGADCRHLFTVPDGYVMVGSDASGLELRCLAHYMNDQHYTDLILNGDIHSYNQKMAGLPTRNNAKTFIYAFLYGAGDAKIGEIVKGGAKEGKALKAKFFKGVPKLKRLIDAVAAKAENSGMTGVSSLKGIDGRRIRIRHAHAALNSLLQSCGAVACKYWLIGIMQQVRKEGLDCTPVGNIHDECQFQVRIGQEERVAQICIEIMEQVGDFLGFRCPLAAEADIGPSWAYTH